MGEIPFLFRVYAHRDVPPATAHSGTPAPIRQILGIV
jgi:hypothetical protein